MRTMVDDLLRCAVPSRCAGRITCGIGCPGVVGWPSGRRRRDGTLERRGCPLAALGWLVGRHSTNDDRLRGRFPANAGSGFGEEALDRRLGLPAETTVAEAACS